MAPLVIALSVASGVLVEGFVGSFGGAAALLMAAAARTRAVRNELSLTVHGVGAEGERLSGRVLAKVDGYVVLHERNRRSKSVT